MKGILRGSPMTECSIDGHQWRLEVDCGVARIVCVDPCDIDPDTWDYSNRHIPACWWVPDSTDFACGEIDITLEYTSEPDWETGLHDDPQMTIAAKGYAERDEILTKYKRLRQHVRKDGTEKVGYILEKDAVAAAARYEEATGMTGFTHYECSVCNLYHVGRLR